MMLRGMLRPGDIASHISALPAGSLLDPGIGSSNGRQRQGEGSSHYVPGHGPSSGRDNWLHSRFASLLALPKILILPPLEKLAPAGQFSLLRGLVLRFM